jgi:hypothetical protein
MTCDEYLVTAVLQECPLLGWCRGLGRRRSFRRGGLRGLDAGKYRTPSAAPLDQHCESDGGEHEEDGGPGRHSGQKVGCSAGSEGGLRSLAAKGAGEVSTLALLEKNHPDQDDANDNVDGTD